MKSLLIPERFLNIQISMSIRYGLIAKFELNLVPLQGEREERKYH